MMGLQIVQARVKHSIHVCIHNTLLCWMFFLPTAYTQSSGLSTPKSYTFWAFEPGWSALTPWWSSSSPYQIMAHTTSGAGACLVDWTEAWTASARHKIPDISEDIRDIIYIYNTIIIVIYSCGGCTCVCVCLCVCKVENICQVWW